MKDLLINLLASVIMMSMTAWWMGKTKNDLPAMCGGMASIVFVISAMITVYFHKRRNRFLADQNFDFKFFADEKGDSCRALGGLYAMFGKKTFDEIGNSPVAVAANENSSTYIKAVDFFSSRNDMLRKFHCRSVRSGQKSGKVFLQLSFIPVDAKGNTLLIQRQGSFHPLQFGEGGKGKLSFISFSPIPPRYNSGEFSVADCYHNEVPYARNECEGCEPSFKELGCVIRKHSGAVYVFWVFMAQYSEAVCFDDVGGTTLKNLFYEDDKAVKKGQAFVKDHDKIITIAKTQDLKAYALNFDMPPLSGTAFSRAYWRVLRLRHLLRRTRIMDVEKRILENFV